MSQSAEFHERAMVLADQGDLSRQRGEHAQARAAWREAMAVERMAAEAEPTEPSRGILYRSAAWLALNAGEQQEAERLARAGLEGDGVPERLESQLREVLAEACGAGRGA